jgi:hypothetical protein
MKEAAEALNGLLGTTSGPTPLKANRTSFPLSSYLDSKAVVLTSAWPLSRLALEPLPLSR